MDLPLSGPSGGIEARQLFTPEPPQDTKTIARWRRELAAVSPHLDQMSYLHLIWEPGWPWEPVGRWMLFDCFPVSATDPEWIKECQGDNPAETLKRDHTNGVLTQYSLITGTQWRVYRETGRYSRPFWVIQGSNGGHKVFFSDAEKKLLQQAGYPDNLPSPGELPYAPFDNRVLRHIRLHDKLVKANGNAKRMAQLSAGKETALLRESRKQIMAWLEDQMADCAAEMVHLLEKQGALPDELRQAGTYTPESRIADEEAHWVETGHIADRRDGVV